MPRARNGEIELEYDHFGDPSGRPLLLIMGYTAQMTAWDDDFCKLLVDAGHFVVRFDNRDCGLSSKTEGPPPNLMALLLQALAGNPITEDVPYTLSDMAADAVAVLDDLDIDAAHVVGASMGGMIAQQMAIEHPDRVATLTSIMSTTGAPDAGRAQPAAQTALFTPPPPERDAIIEWIVGVGRTISGPLYDETKARQRAIAAYERSFHPAGGAFQIAAIAKTGDRTEALGGLHVPTLVIHGKVDPLVQLSGGEATAAAIPGARLLVIDEMGHDLPEAIWPEIVSAIAEHSTAT